MMPSLLMPVRVSRYRLPENNRMPTTNETPAQVTMRPGMCGQQRNAQQRQGVHQLVGDAGVENRQVFGAQAAFQGMGGKCPQRHACEAEKSGQHQKATQHENSSQTRWTGSV